MLLAVGAANYEFTQITVGTTTLLAVILMEVYLLDDRDGDS